MGAQRMPKEEKEEAAGLANASVFGSVKKKKPFKATNGTVDENTDAATKTPKSKKLGSTKTDEAKNVKSDDYNLTTASKDKDEMEDEALEMVVKGFKFYRKEYKRLVVENGELWQENQKIKKAYDALKNDATQLKNLMNLVTGEMGSALTMMAEASKDANLAELPE